MVGAERALAEGREVVVSRGELIEIGGSFRIPDVMEKSGATLREVGTTNRTRIADYERAINERTRLILRVHPSNYRIIGFTERPSVREIASLASRAGIPSFGLAAYLIPTLAGADYFATPEIHQALVRRFGLAPASQAVVDSNVAAHNAVRDCLGTDIRYIEPPYTGPALPRFDDGSTMNIWGIRRRPMPNEFGEYAEPVGSPYAPWTTIEEAERFPWPSPDWFDYAAVSGLSREMREKLGRVRPRTIGQASRIPGVTPAAVSLVNVYIEIQARQKQP